MGTSHRHKLGVAGQPNWGSVSSSITGIANGVVESDMLDNNPPANMTPQQKSKRQSIIGSRISNNYHHAVRNLLRRRQATMVNAINIISTYSNISTGIFCERANSRSKAIYTIGRINR